jgi:hypothetical protein
MSVVAQSPYSAGSSKRLFNSEQDTGSDQFGAVKRARCLSSPAGRCRPSSSQSPPHNSHNQCVHPATVAAVKALFPDMDEQVRFPKPCVLDDSCWELCWMPYAYASSIV